MKDLSLRSSYEFELPEELIATQASEPRDSARLLEVRGSDLVHRHFYDLKEILRPNDLIVLNDVSVQRARFYAQRQSGGRVEILITGDASRQEKSVTCMYKSRRCLEDKEILNSVDEPGLRLCIHKEASKGSASVEFLSQEPVLEILSRIGQMPLPPYIMKRRQSLGGFTYEKSDDAAYQTVYAKSGAAVAAPTAGLHFTEEQMGALEERGIKFGRLRLDVGQGTFRPVRSEIIDEHPMHSERYFVDESLVRAVEECKCAKGRVVAVGTTVVRSLEDSFLRFAKLKAGVFETDIFIKHGHRFGIVDALITNFHLPASTLLVLVSAFAGYDEIRHAYEAAILEKYRFYSYGDAMFLYHKPGKT